MTKRIIAASDQGLAPAAIAKLLGVETSHVYTVRWHEKKRRGEEGCKNWYQQEVAKAAKQNKTEAKMQLDAAYAKNPTDWDEIVRGYKAMEAQTSPAVQAYNLTPFTSPLPKFTFDEPHAPALLPPQTFFARVKAAYAVLRGVKK
jgi:hypothetical protein